ncbi:hypothetical protein BU25DRAFT_104663 [Macroventuria anomochaeta]|uniref:Uncharacterized protein n=1 Tax=Macroventuria anomochaeta TaxID=301207 RepID=A0ACB6RY24_9PLEO|nr:uncharacterized protein BU25DRAFT_104663 [Macroventuria anomochaeta]KAF2625839.1 hypothetical protein BU25DRAFT_104663 [Macroventuria anomochaeta]
MSNVTSTLAKRFSARTIPLPVISTQYAVFSKPIDVDAIKQRATDWEPTIDFTDLKMRSTDQGCDDNNEPGLAHMVTYSTSDPGASSPLLLSSALPISVSSLAGNAATTSTPDHHERARHNTAIAGLELRTELTISTLHHAIEVQQTTPAPTVDGTKFKPWPYSLPKPLQPKGGTTYDLMYGEGVGVGDGQVGKMRIGVLQKVLYGVPGSGEKEGDGEEGHEGKGKGKGLWEKIVCGVQEGDGKAGC